MIGTATTYLTILIQNGPQELEQALAEGAKKSSQLNTTAAHN